MHLDAGRENPGVIGSWWCNRSFNEVLRIVTDSSRSRYLILCIVLLLLHLAGTASADESPQPERRGTTWIAEDLYRRMSPEDWIGLLSPQSWHTWTPRQMSWSYRPKHPAAVDIPPTTLSQTYGAAWLEVSVEHLGMEMPGDVCIRAGAEGTEPLEIDFHYDWAFSMSFDVGDTLLCGNELFVLVSVEQLYNRGHGGVAIVIALPVKPGGGAARLVGWHDAPTRFSWGGTGYVEKTVEVFLDHSCQASASWLTVGSEFPSSGRIQQTVEEGKWELALGDPRSCSVEELVGSDNQKVAAFRCQGLEDGAVPPDGLGGEYWAESSERCSLVAVGTVNRATWLDNKIARDGLREAVDGLPTPECFWYATGATK